MSVQQPTAEVETELTVRVPRGDAGSLGDGARTVIEALDPVVTVEIAEIGTMRPDAFDLYVDATARVELATEDPEATLADGFGVVEIDRCEVL